MRIGPQRPVNPDAVVAPQGYRVEALVTGLSFPCAISFGPGGELYLAESGGVAGSLVAVPRVLRLDPDRSVTEIGRLDNPIVGVVYRQGELLIAEDGFAPRILRVTAEGEVRVLVQGLPGGGDYGLSGLSLDPSGALLFGLGTRTNSGVVGLDNEARGWVGQHPEWADVPGADVELLGVNYVTARPTSGGTARVTTGSFKPFGQRCAPGERVRGAQRCGGAIYRLAVEATEPERLAWGFRNPVGVACNTEGQIFASEGGMEERGSRPIADAPDNLWEVRAGSYYGWPDHAGGIPVTDPRFRLPGHAGPRPLLDGAPKVAGAPVATFPSRTGVGRFDFCSEAFGFAGDALVALSGAWSAAAFAGEETPPASRRVVRIDRRSGEISDFLANRQSGPASAGNGGGLERPFDVRFDPTGEVLYVVDLGEVLLDREHGLEPFGGTGVVWRITRTRPMLQVPPLGAEAVEEEEDELDAGSADGDAEEAEEASEAFEPQEESEEPVASALDRRAEAEPSSEEAASDGWEAPGSEETASGEEREAETAAAEPSPGRPGGAAAQADEPDDLPADRSADEPSPEPRPVVESVFEEEAPPLSDAPETGGAPLGADVDARTARSSEESAASDETEDRGAGEEAPSAADDPAAPVVGGEEEGRDPLPSEGGVGSNPDSPETEA
jgi:glucose/arabinose dehydrogenase